MYKKLVYVCDKDYIDECIANYKIPVLDLKGDYKSRKVVMGKCDELWCYKGDRLENDAKKWRKVIVWLD